MDIITTMETPADGLAVGHIYIGDEGDDLSSSGFELTIPAGVVGLDRRPCHVEDQMRRHYITGQWSRPLVITEFRTIFEAGLPAPAAPGLTSAAGGTLDGIHIGYLSYRHKVGDTIVHEGNLSTGSVAVVMNAGTASKRVWSMAAGAPTSRVTHIVLWASVDGALPKEVVELAIGTTTYTETIATAALGDPPPTDADGNLKNARGIPPATRFVVKYHRRAWYGGDASYPFRWWYSELDEFESVGDQNFLDHLDHETTVGAGAAGDSFVSFGQQVAYVIQGWDADDFRIARVSPSIGCLSHFAIVNISEILWFPSEAGMSLYIPGAGFRPLMHKDLATYWAEEYAANPAAFEDAIAADDRVKKVYRLLVSYPADPLSRCFVGHYQRFDPSVGEGGSMPDWTFDLRDRQDTCVGNLRVANRKRTESFTGSLDGYLRKENVESDNSDDGDTYQKTMILDTPHYLPGQQEGDDDDGFVFNSLTVFLRSELSWWTIEGRAGDDTAYQATNAAWPRTTPASLKTVGNKTAVAKTSHKFPVSGLSGKGCMFRLIIPLAQAVEYRGLALSWEDGKQSRPFIG